MVRMTSVLITIGLIAIGLIAAVFVVAGLICATVVLIDEVRRITDDWLGQLARVHRARAEAQRRYRVPTQR